ncbi:hypothetical protein C8R47DRAFT_1268751 [Mycena vitilis]|nr:hypothetical protein C8R47DRAFT_1268751 [Mycena vitilis]
MQRAKREAQQRTTASLTGRRHGPSIAVSSSMAANESISAPLPVKLEPVSVPIPLASEIPPSVQKTWRHPDELPFITDAETWDDMAIARFIRASALSVPSRPAKTTEAWIIVRCADGREVSLPRGYCIPLLWVSKFLWLSAKIVLSTPGDWALERFDLLHVARLIDTLVCSARAAIDGGGIDRSWRCAAFDRALWRYWHKWLVMRDEYVEDFWNEFGEGDFEPDVLKQGWPQWVLKGHKGFALTKTEVNNGITEAEFVRGFVLDESSGRIAWVQENASAGQADVPLALPAAADESVFEQSPSTSLPVTTTSTSVGKPKPSASTTTSTPDAKPKPSVPGTTSTSTAKPKPSAPATTSTAKPKPKPKGKATFKSESASNFISKSTSAAPASPTEQGPPLTIRIPAVEKPIDAVGRPSRKRKSSTSVAPEAPPRKKLSLASAEVPILDSDKAPTPMATAAMQRDALSASAPVHGSVSLAALVSRIPLGGGRHRAHRQSDAFADASISHGGRRVSQPDVRSTAPLAVEQTVRMQTGREIVPSPRPSTEMRDASAPNVQGANAEVVPPLPTGKTGCAPFRGHPTDVFKHLLREQSAKSRESSMGAGSLGVNARELDAEREDQREAQGKNEDNMMDGKFDPDVTLEESDLGEDLQLFYPESSPVQTRPQLRPFTRESGATSRASSPSESCSSSSRSPSPRIPSMSSARFSPSTPVSPDPPPTSALFSLTSASASTAIARSSNAHQLASTSYHHLAVRSSASTSTALQLSPRAPLRLLPGGPFAELSSESNAHIIERFAQSYGDLRAEVSMLRAQLRAIPTATGQLETRVRRLEIASQNPSPHLTLSSSSNGSASPIEESLFQSNSAHRHPLQHLISGGEVEMDVDSGLPERTI